MNEYIYLATILACGFLVRALPRVLRPNAVVSDTYFHLYRARSIRDAGFRLSKTLPRVLLPHQNTYPFLYHYLLALFPAKARLHAERLTGAVFDTMSAVFVYMFAAWLVAQQEGNKGMEHLPLIVTLGFVLSPALLRIGSGPRAYNGSPRTVGQTLYLAHIITAIVSIHTGNLWMALLSVTAGALIIVTAKFSVQVLVFFSPFFILVLPQYLSLLALSFVFSVILTRGAALSVIRGQISHSVFYVRHLQQIFLFPNVVTMKAYLQRWVRAVLLVVCRKPADALQWFFRENYPLHLLIFVFTTFFVLFLGVDRLANPAPLEIALFCWCLAGLLWFALTKFKPLMFLGEGERYLEYALFPSLFLAGTLFWNNNLGISLYLGFCLVAALTYARMYLSDYETTNNQYGFINAKLTAGIDQTAVIWPIGSHHFEVLYHSNNPIITHGVNIDGRLFKLDDFKLVYGNYPYPSKHWRQILRLFNVRYVYSSDSSLEYYLNHIVEDKEDFKDCLVSLHPTSKTGLWKVQV